MSCGQSFHIIIIKPDQKLAYLLHYRINYKNIKKQKYGSQLCTESHSITDVHLDCHHSGVLSYFFIQLPECHSVNTLVFVTRNTKFQSVLVMLTHQFYSNCLSNLPDNFAVPKCVVKRNDAPLPHQKKTELVVAVVASLYGKYRFTTIFTKKGGEGC